MTAPMAELLTNACVIAAKKDEFHIGSHTKTLAIFSFESGAVQHNVLPRCERPLDLLAQMLQPRPSVLVRQWMTAVHLLDICCQMKIIGFKKMPTEFAREQFAHCGFSSTGNSEDDQNHDALVCRRRPIFSKKNATTTKSV